MFMTNMIWNEKGSIKTLILALIFVVLLVATITQKNRRIQAAREIEEQHSASIVEAVESTEIHSIEIFELLQKTELRLRDDGNWWVGTASIMPNMSQDAKEAAEIRAWDLADQDAVLQVIDAVQTSLRNWEEVSRNREKRIDYRIGPLGSEFRLKNEQGKELMCISVGEKAADFSGTYVALCNEDEIYKVPGILEYIFKREPNDWRTKVLHDLDKDKLVKMEIKSADASNPVILEKDENGNWLGTSPREFVPDKKRMDSLLTQFCTYRARGFPERMRANTIETITLELTGIMDDNSEWKLLFGTSEGGMETLVKSDRNAIIYAAGYQDIENLNLDATTLSSPS